MYNLRTCTFVNVVSPRCHLQVVHTLPLDTGVKAEQRRRRNNWNSFSFLWPCIVSKLWSERENQQDATVRCLLSTISQHVSGIIMPIFRRPRRTQYPTKKTIQLISTFSPLVTAQHTTCSNTRLGLLNMSIMMPETCWESVDNKHLTVASCWFSLSLHNLKQFCFDSSLGYSKSVYVLIAVTVCRVQHAPS